MIKNLIRKFVPQSLISLYHFLMALFGAILYRFPSRKIKIIAVTGTNGKSTTVELTTSTLEEAGYKVAALSSVKFKIKEKELPNNLRMTMPGRFFIQKFLRQAVSAECDYAVLEVTSEGIKQYRHKFLNFEAAVLTNLTPEHIESHGGFENYKKAKGKLFNTTKNVHIINLDDENADCFLQFPAREKYLYKIKNRASIYGSEGKDEDAVLIATQIPKTKPTDQKEKIVEAENCRATDDGVKFLINNTEFNLKLLGEFNIYNALAAICVGLSQGISLETSKRALERVAGIPGRMELVIQEPFKVFVDYAFTPNALEKVYNTLANLHEFTANNTNKISEISGRISAHSRLICVLGACGGGRDKWKRPVLGEIAAKYCQEIIITNEDPYDENPMEIVEQVAVGTKGRASKILDRREAINKAISLAKQGDVVIITGKGCEPSICLASGKKIPWDDRAVVKEEFAKIKQR